MIDGLHGYIQRTWDEAQDRNRQGLIDLLRNSGGTLLDLGCAEGAYTMQVARAIGAEKVMGVEIEPDAAAEAAERGAEVTIGDLNLHLDLHGGVADGIVANQVIEHLNDTDNLVSEAYRLLKPGGVLAISTENISAWYNIVAITLGWQPFSLTNISGKGMGVGNPLALHRGAAGQRPPYQHKRLFAPVGLRELLELHGFKVEEMKGYGYFPLRGVIAELLSSFDWRHSAFIAAKARK